MWYNITNMEDIEMLMKKFGNFHDSCLKEMKYVSGAFINSDLSMYPINDKRSLKIKFQRQYENPMTIEIEFLELIKLNLEPCNEMFSAEVRGVSMFFKDSYIYWYDNNTYKKSENNTWICAKKAKWRICK